LGEKIADISMTFVNNLQQFGQDIADLLQSNEDQYKGIFIHGFSVGAGMWAMTQKIIAEVSFLIIEAFVILKFLSHRIRKNMEKSLKES
jgi:uncharacterized membrane protein YoaK (UPF0700 family)